MNKGKFASLIMLGVFSAGCIQNGIVSAMAEDKDSFVSLENGGDLADSREDLVDIVGEGKNNVEAVNEIDAEDEGNKVTDGSETSKEIQQGVTEAKISENDGSVFVGRKNLGEKRGGPLTAKELAAMSGAGGVLLGVGGGVGAVKLFGTSAKKGSITHPPGENGSEEGDNSSNPINKSTDNPDKAETIGNKGDAKPKCEKNFLDFYKTHLGASIPLTIMFAYIAYLVIRIIIVLIYAGVKTGHAEIVVRPFFGLTKKSLGSLFVHDYAGKVRDGIIAVLTFGKFRIYVQQEDMNIRANHLMPCLVF